MWEFWQAVNLCCFPNTWTFEWLYLHVNLHVHCWLHADLQYIKVKIGDTELCFIYHSSTALAWFLSCMTIEYVYISRHITCLVVYACCTNLCVKSVPSLFRACCLGPLIPIMLLLAAFTMAALGICMAARVVLPWVLQTEEVLVCTLFEWVPTGDCCNI